jgi:hypothetical protein
MQIRGRGRSGGPQGQIAGRARGAGAHSRAYGFHPLIPPARAPSGWSQPGQERPLWPTRAYLGGLWAMGGRRELVTAGEANGVKLDPGIS